MATAPSRNTAQQILEEVGSLRKDVQDTRAENAELKTAIGGLLELARTPASKAGVSPQEYLRGMASQNGAVLFGADGDRMNPKGSRRQKHMLGGTTRADNQKGSFGEFLTAYHDFHNVHASHEQREKAFQTVKAYGTQTIRFQGDHDTIVKTALAESSAVTGGYTVPPMFEEQLFELAIENVIVQPRARKYPLTSRTLQIPALDQTNTSFTATAGQSNLLGGLVASWMAEAATRNESEPQFRQVVLTAWELSFYALASNTLLADNAVGLDAFLTQLFGYAMGWYPDYAFFQGNGVGQPLGILNSPAALTVARQTASSFTFQDVANMVGKLYWMLRGGNSLAWVIHQSVIPKLFQMNDGSGTTAGTGRVLFIPMNQGVQEKIPQSDGVQSIGYLAGWPVLVSEKVPALGTQGDVSLIDFDKYALGQRMDMEIMVSPHVKFLNNQMAWRVVMRIDGQPLLNKAVTLADGVKTVSPFVVLQ